jgi:hypothetical protein
MIESKIEDKVRSKKDLRKTELRHVTISYTQQRSPLRLCASCCCFCTLLWCRTLPVLVPLAAAAFVLDSIMVSYSTGTTVKTIVLHYPDVLGAHSASPPRPYASAYV